MALVYEIHENKVAVTTQHLSHVTLPSSSCKLFSMLVQKNGTNKKNRKDVWMALVYIQGGSYAAPFQHNHPYTHKYSCKLQFAEFSTTLYLYFVDQCHPYIHPHNYLYVTG